MGLDREQALELAQRDFEGASVTSFAGDLDQGIASFKVRHGPQFLAWSYGYISTWGDKGEYTWCTHRKGNVAWLSGCEASVGYYLGKSVESLRTAHKVFSEDMALATIDGLIEDFDPEEWEGTSEAFIPDLEYIRSRVEYGYINTSEEFIEELMDAGYQDAWEWSPDDWDFRSRYLTHGAGIMCRTLLEYLSKG